MSCRLDHPISQLQASPGRRERLSPRYRVVMPNRNYPFADILRALMLTAIVVALTIRPLSLAAQSPAVDTTVAIFADHAIPDAQWSAIFASIRSELASNDPELAPITGPSSPEQISAQLQLFRGDRISPGIVLSNSISVYLHGDCATAFAPRIALSSLHDMPADALGWVRQQRGRIEPFIHINCALITQILRSSTVRRTVDDANRIVALAIARIFLHEWLHIATQSPHHARSGIAKADFSVHDLIDFRPRPTAPASATGTQSFLAAPRGPAHGK